MRVFKRILRVVVILFFLVRILLPVIIENSDLEYANYNIRDFFEEFFFFGTPLFILITLFFTVLKQNSTEVKIVKVIATITLAFIIFFFSSLLIMFDMCVESIGGTLYINKEDHSTKIVRRHFGCGATDTGPDIISTVKMEEVTPFFIYITPIDTNEIDKSEWLKINY